MKPSLETNMKPDAATKVAKLTVIIVNYRSRAYLERCFDHLLESQFDGELELLLVNNSPEDDTRQWLADHYPRVKYLEYGRNLGFGPANNRGFGEGEGDVFLLVNPDAFVPADGIQQSYDYLREHPRVGVVGPQFVNDEGHPQPSARMFPSVLDKFFMLTGLAARFPNSRLFGRMDRTWWDHSHPQKVDWVVGAFFMVRADLIRKLDGFDPRFFLYFEELDLCRRVKKLGYEVHYLPQVVVHHVGGASSEKLGERERTGKQLTLLRLFSEALYYGKYYGRLGVWVMLGMEKIWFRIRLLKNRRNHSAEGEAKRRAFSLHIRQIEVALKTTRYGRLVPEHPWKPDITAYGEEAPQS